MKKYLVALGLALVSLTSFAADPVVKNTGDVSLAKIGKTYTCKLIRAVDGDTLDAKCPVLGTVRVRVSGIDTPDRGQPFYKEATAFAEANAGGPNRMINVVATQIQLATDRYEARLVGRVYDTKRGLYAKKAASAGFAWGAENSSVVIKTAQAKAKSDKLGLWSHLNPIAPSDWRAGKR